MYKFARLLLIIILLLTTSNFAFNIKVVKAAGPTVTFSSNIQGGYPNYPGGNPIMGTLTWSSTGATHCESTGSNLSGWGYNPSLPTSGSSTVMASGRGESDFVITCFNSAGESTTKSSSTVAYNVGGADCAVFPEIVQSSYSASITNLTTSESVSISSPGQEQGPDLPVAIGDSILISYNTWSNGSEPSPRMTSSTSPGFRMGNSTVTTTAAVEGDFVIDSLTSTTGSIEVSARDCGNAIGFSYVNFTTRGNTPTFTCSPEQLTATVNPGSGTTFIMDSTPQNGFSGNITYTADVTPNPANAPQVSFGNNNQPVGGTTTANVTTSVATPGDDYNLNFIGTSGGLSVNCTPALLHVNSVAKNFNIVLSPGQEVGGPAPDQHTPNRILSGSNKVFTVFADCTGGFTGPVTNLTAHSEFSSVSLVIDLPDNGANGKVLNCGATTTLTVGETGSIQGVDLSSPSGGTLLKSISVDGTGLIN